MPASWASDGVGHSVPAQRRACNRSRSPARPRAARAIRRRVDLSQCGGVGGRVDPHPRVDASRPAQDRRARARRGAGHGRGQERRAPRRRVHLHHRPRIAVEDRGIERVEQWLGEPAWSRRGPPGRERPPGTSRTAARRSGRGRSRGLHVGEVLGEVSAQAVPDERALGGRGHSVSPEQLLGRVGAHAGDRPRDRQVLEQQLGRALPCVLALQPALQRLGVTTARRRG